MKRKILKKSFFLRPALETAEDLLGKILVRKIGQKELVGIITEVEAYDGPEDKASHASRGITERNAPMFDVGGYFYIYLCYGMYEMLNFVTGPKNYPAAILIRGAVVLPLLDKERAGVRSVALGGPGKLTKYFKISRALNKKPIAPSSGLWVEDWGIKIDKKRIEKLPRVGVAYAGPLWSKKPYRFLLTKDEK